MVRMLFVIWSCCFKSTNQSLCLQGKTAYIYPPKKPHQVEPLALDHRDVNSICTIQFKEKQLLCVVKFDERS